MRIIIPNKQKTFYMINVHFQQNNNIYYAKIYNDFWSL